MNANKTVTATFNTAPVTATVSLVASHANPQIGNTFTVTMNVTNAPPFANWQAYLKFDKTKLELTAQATGSFTTFISDSRARMT